MPGQTTERAFEFHVEDLRLKQGGWLSGTNAEWDKARLPAAHFLGYAPDDLDNLAEDLVYKLDQQTRSEAA